MTILEVQDIHTYYGDAYVLQGLSLQLEQGQILGLLGRNGVGKTTTIGKLANRFKNDGKKVVLCDADTFRAAASEQLEIWAKRSDVPIVKQQAGADPSAVLFETVLR